jgi:hypothetical protein
MNIPKKVWVCGDCNVIVSADKATGFHTGHVGRSVEPNELFAEKKRSMPHWFTGETIWVHKDSKEYLKYLDTLVSKITEKLTILSEERRLEVFSKFCKYCGIDDPKCQCWNDE